MIFAGKALISPIQCFILGLNDTYVPWYIFVLSIIFSFLRGQIFQLVDDSLLHYAK